MKKAFKIVGEINGRPGDYELRKHKNKLVICQRTKRRPTESKAQAEAKRKFGIITSIAAAISRNKYLKIIWSNNGGNNRIVKENYAYFDPTEPYNFHSIVPTPGFYIEGGGINISQRGIKIEVKLSKRHISINPEVEKRTIAAGVLILSEPQDEKDREFMAIGLQSGAQEIKLDEQVNIEIELYGEDRNYLSYYKKARVLLTILTLDKDSVPVQYSSVLRGES